MEATHTSVFSCDGAIFGEVVHKFLKHGSFPSTPESLSGLTLNVLFRDEKEVVKFIDLLRRKYKDICVEQRREHKVVTSSNFPVKIKIYTNLTKIPDVHKLLFYGDSKWRYSDTDGVVANGVNLMKRYKRIGDFGDLGLSDENDEMRTFISNVKSVIRKNKLDFGTIHCGGMASSLKKIVINVSKFKRGVNTFLEYLDTDVELTKVSDTKYTCFDGKFSLEFDDCITIQELNSLIGTMCIEQGISFEYHGNPHRFDIHVGSKQFLISQFVASLKCVRQVDLSLNKVDSNNSALSSDQLDKAYICKVRDSVSDVQGRSEVEIKFYFNPQPPAK